jgi:hypothetical protein
MTIKISMAHVLEYNETQIENAAYADQDFVISGSVLPADR